MDAHYLERVALVERRQQTVQPLCQHRLAGAGRPDQQQVMGTRRGDLEGAFRRQLAFYVGEFERL